MHSCSPKGCDLVRAARGVWISTPAQHSRSQGCIVCLARMHQKRCSSITDAAMGPVGKIVELDEPHCSSLPSLMQRHKCTRSLAAVRGGKQLLHFLWWHTRQKC